MKNEYHEIETIIMSSDRLRSRRELDTFLKERGYRFSTDFYYLDRPDKAMPWQSISVITVNIFASGAPVSEIEEDIDYSEGWDELRIDYLLATLPSTFIKQCAQECEAIVSYYQLKVEHDGKTLHSGELESVLDSIADKLKTEWDNPGSESLAILIDMSYGR